MFSGVIALIGVLQLFHSLAPIETHHVRPNLPSSSQTWFSHAFLAASLVASRPTSFLIYQQSQFYRRHVGFNCMGLCVLPKSTPRHETGLRLLLIISGDVEQNPGPVTDWKANDEPILRAALADLLLDTLDDDDHTLPDALDEVISRLEGFDPQARTLALRYANRPPLIAASSISSDDNLPAYNEALAKLGIKHEPSPMANLPSESHQTPPDDHLASMIDQRLTLMLQNQSNATTHQTPATNPTAPQSVHSSDTKLVGLPPFCQTQCKAWFEQCEVLLGHLHPDTQHRSLIKAIPTETLTESGAKATDPFSTIKKHLITHFDATDVQLTRRFLATTELGDRKPSATLREMRKQVTDHNMVRIRFLQILPEHVRMILAGLDTVPLDQLGETADKMMEQASHHQSSTCFAINGNTTGNPTGVHEQLAALTQEIAYLRTDRQSRSRTRSPSPSDRGRQNRSSDRARSQSRARYTPDTNLCWYHFRYGRLARNCTEPCQWDNRSPPDAPHFTGNDDALPHQRPTVGQ